MVKTKFIWRWLPVFVIALAIYLLSDIPNLRLYDERLLSPFWREFIHKYTIRIGTTGFFSYVISPHPDFVLHKLGHMAVYAALGTACFLATKRACWAIIISLLYAIADEIHQGFVIGRSCRFWDIVLDTASASAAIWLVKLFFTQRKSCKQMETNRK